jgi:hypothetical protein
VFEYSSEKEIGQQDILQGKVYLPQAYIPQKPALRMMHKTS